jgi:hypothetical protein
VPNETLDPVAAIAAIAAAAALLVALVALRRARTAERRLAALLADEAGTVGDGRLTKALAALREQGALLEEAGQRLARVEAALPGAVSRMGLVHFQAFEDVGGGQSSALALLDDRGDGAVVTTIHSRTGTRMYVKRIAAGRGEATLGAEEAEAVAAALAAPRGTSATR